MEPKSLWAEEAARAAELLRIVFPEGLSFLKLEYNQQWAATDEKLLRIETDGLEASINEIAGPAYLERVRRAFRGWASAPGRSNGQRHRPSNRPARGCTC